MNPKAEVKTLLLRRCNTSYAQKFINLCGCNNGCHRHLVSLPFDDAGMIEPDEIGAKRVYMRALDAFSDKKSLDAQRTSTRSALSTFGVLDE
jgi:hypothetical protein